MKKYKNNKQSFSEYEESGAECEVLKIVVSGLSDYFSAISSLLTPDETFWFRGHSKNSFELIPSALRHKEIKQRDIALKLIADFRRYAEFKIKRIPDQNDKLQWLQLAQHYGLGTRLLDWTENAAAALYFACQDSKENGAVYILNPIDLNMVAWPKRPKILNASQDLDIISKYLRLTGKLNPRGLKTIAIHPVLNSERIVMQRGVFTLHGARKFGLDGKQASSLVKVPIMREHKDKLLLELDRIGIGEASIFPELEHICNYLNRKAKLNKGS